MLLCAVLNKWCRIHTCIVSKAFLKRLFGVTAMNKDKTAV